MIDRRTLHVKLVLLHMKLSMVIGFSPITLLRSIAGIPFFVASLRKYGRLNQGQRSFQISLRNLFPVLTDRRDSAGTVRGHYFHQDLWAARKIFERSPKNHVDIGSRVDGFIAHVLTFMPVTIIDIRRLESTISGLSYIRDDATELSQFADGSVESLSSLHAAEHFGLGRYSDPIDPDACFKFMRSLERVLAPGGSMYFSVPIGEERLEFNAQRIFAPRTIIENFPQLKLMSFSYVDDVGLMHDNQDPVAIPMLQYGCGLFHFMKVSAVENVSSGARK